MYMYFRTAADTAKARPDATPAAVGNATARYFVLTVPLVVSKAGSLFRHPAGGRDTWSGVIRMVIVFAIDRAVRCVLRCRLATSRKWQSNWIALLTHLARQSPTTPKPDKGL